MSHALSEIEVQGYSMVPSVLSEAEAMRLVESLGAVNGAGRRGMLMVPEVRGLAESAELMSLVRPYLSGRPRAVRSIYFDKSPEANWLVPWHQDLTLAVNGRVEVAGFGPWSMKAGVTHVQPPVSLLEQMITVRIHLDAADGSNGALKVIPGSHEFGRLEASEIERIKSETPECLCCADRGDALLMRPLILHASGRSTSDRHRRVLHIEYAGFELPAGLSWNDEA
ncbi:MAG: phytanoyl-CoA dioxygenase family protein [Prosthecobacter sp.]|nr:phytanoyl-CoA dioxygenase family protein [Prosthecobacter sp.]